MSLIEQKIQELREITEQNRENIGERMAQYQSECAMFGDAGPGQHPSLWLREAEKQLAEDEATLAALEATPEGQTLLVKEYVYYAGVRRHFDGPSCPF